MQILHIGTHAIMKSMDTFKVASSSLTFQPETGIAMPIWFADTLSQMTSAIATSYISCTCMASCSSATLHHRKPDSAVKLVECCITKDVRSYTCVLLAPQHCLHLICRGGSQPGIACIAFSFSVCNYQAFRRTFCFARQGWFFEKATDRTLHKVL